MTNGNLPIANTYNLERTQSSAVNTEQLRQVVREKWLNYYEENREWLTRLGVWVNCDGQRRPSSGFILATLSVLEPRLTQLLPLIVDLSSNPDRIVMALGLNFNPDELLLETTEADKAIADDRGISTKLANGPIRMLPSAPKVVDVQSTVAIPPVKEVARVRAREDESCRGSRQRRD